MGLNAGILNKGRSTRIDTQKHRKCLIMYAQDCVVFTFKRKTFHVLRVCPRTLLMSSAGY